MKLLRIQDLCLLAALIAPGSAVTPITLLEVLKSYPELSTLNSHVNTSLNATGFLSSANNNFTFLAPSNDAISSLLSQNPNALTEDLLDATLQYSLLKGGFPALSFSNTSQFVASNLVNGSYANVTGGQAAELVLSSSGSPQVVTGNKSISTASTVCTKSLAYPVTLITVARISFAVVV